MPSLRRSLSSPAVRSAPYSTSSSAAVRGSPGGRRRSSGTEVSGRRVLADLEWWSVVDGQLNVNGEAPPSGRRLYVDENLDTQDRPSTPVVEQSSSSEILGLSPARFAAMTLGPRTPPRISRHASDSSVRSLESTPELEELPLLEGHLCYDDEDEEEDDLLVDLFLVSPETSSVSTAKRTRSRSEATRRLGLGRSYSYTSSVPYPATDPSSRKRVARPKAWLPRDDYADFTISPLSSHAPDLYD